MHEIDSTKLFMIEVNKPEHYNANKLIVKESKVIVNEYEGNNLRKELVSKIQNVHTTHATMTLQCNLCFSFP